LQDADFLRSLLLTLVYALGTVPLEMAAGLAVALVLHQRLRFRGLFRLLYFLPYVTSQVAVALVWGWVFNPSYGAANGLLASLGAMTSFNLIYVMGGGGQAFGCAGNPLGTTQVAALFVFDRFWCQTELGYASAAAFVLGLLILALSALNGRLFGRRTVYVG